METINSYHISPCIDYHLTVMEVSRILLIRIEGKEMSPGTETFMAG